MKTLVQQRTEEYSSGPGCRLTDFLGNVSFSSSRNLHTESGSHKNSNHSPLVLPSFGRGKSTRFCSTLIDNWWIVSKSQKLRERRSSISIVTGLSYGVDSQSSIPGRGKDSFSSPSRSDRLWGPLSFLSDGYLHSLVF